MELDQCRIVSPPEGIKASLPDSVSHSKGMDTHQDESLGDYKT